ncbi:hypothetical protein SMMN14_06382 [Sphaerulina musiva]
MDLRRVAWSQRTLVIVLAIQAVFLLLLLWSRNPFHLKQQQQHRTTNSLTTEQCLNHFPDLYYEIDRAVHLWKSKNHTISEADVDISWQATGPFDGGALKILIHENQLRVLESINAMADSAYQERGLGILQLLLRALESATAAGEILPTIEAAIVLQDISYPPTEDGTHSFWTWARPLRDVHFNRTNVWQGQELHYERFWKDETFRRVWLVPNFDLWATGSIGEFEESRRLAREFDRPSIADKIPKVVWRGTEWVNPEIRDKLVNVSRGKSWADVKYSNSTPATNINNKEEEEQILNKNNNHLPISHLCSYALTIHTEGFSYSGRLSHLLNCNSLPIIHNLTYTTHYYHLLQASGPQQNYVSVRNDFSDLEDTVQYFLSHPEEADVIVRNSVKTFRERYLTPEAGDCYLRLLVRGYKDVAFEPRVFRAGMGRVGKKGASWGIGRGEGGGRQKVDDTGKKTKGAVRGKKLLWRGRSIREFLEHPEDFKEGEA